MDPLARAQELEDRLAALLSLLETPAAPPEAIEDAARALSSSFEALRTSAAELGAARATLLRLNAVAAGVVSTQLSSLSERLARVRGARAHLAALRGDSASGRACDVAG